MNFDSSYKNEHTYYKEISTSWIKWFTNKSLTNFLVEVDAEYIMEAYNSYEIELVVSNVDKLISIILGDSPINYEDDSKEKYLGDAALLYSTLHKKFILTPKGLAIMKDKYTKGDYGTCPRVSCAQYHVLPIGLHESIRIAPVHIYCPSCQEIYKISYEKNMYLDGAFFGTSFPHLFLQTYPNYKTLKTPTCCIPRIFGFGVYQNFTRIEYKIMKGEFGEQARAKFLAKKPKYIRKLLKTEAQIKDTNT
ncbi:casein kinase II beta chain [Hepatocystis sp. ex Piliocolobus tephrosceles]|nr:casein kinase II beta chain [Hepatocystis sp. ex Piliocolobus tephrosceles]